MENNNKINLLDPNLKNNQGGFGVPENYFENFDDKLMQKIQNSSKTPNKSNKRNIYRWVSIGLSAAAILTIAFFNTKPQNQTVPATEATELSWDQYASFDESWILQELAETDDETDELSTEIDILMDYGVTGDEVIEAISQMPEN